MNVKNSNVEEDGYKDKIDIDINKRKNLINQFPSDANSERSDDANLQLNDTTIPFDVNGDDEIQQSIVQTNLPEHGNLNKESNFPDKKDLVPMKDRIPSKIRNNDDPADVDI